MGQQIKRKFLPPSRLLHQYYHERSPPRGTIFHTEHRIKCGSIIRANPRYNKEVGGWYDFVMYTGTNGKESLGRIVAIMEHADKDGDLHFTVLLIAHRLLEPENQQYFTHSHWRMRCERSEQDSSWKPKLLKANMSRLTRVVMAVPKLRYRNIKDQTTSGPPDNEIPMETYHSKPHYWVFAPRDTWPHKYSRHLSNL